jgi:hypothetical protein
MSRLEVLDAQMRNTPDQQISLTDPDARSMATSGRGSGVVGYNVQVAVDTEHRKCARRNRRHTSPFSAISSASASLP